MIVQTYSKEEIDRLTDALDHAEKRIERLEAAVRGGLKAFAQDGDHVGAELMRQSLETAGDSK